MGKVIIEKLDCFGKHGVLKEENILGQRFFVSCEMETEFENAAFALELNTVSEPVKTQFGYHLIKIEAKNEASVAKFEDVKEQIIGNLMQQAQQNKYAQLMKELEAKYQVKRA